jgi:Uma2 family endonuclease
MNAPVRILPTREKVRLTVDSFLLLDEHGAFADYHKTELIDGDVYGMNAQHSRHARVKSRLLVELALALRALGGDLEAVSEVTVRVADDGAPEPDIVLTRWRGEGVMPVATVALMVEVSDTTLATDLGRKAELYGAAGVPEYWVVDLNGVRVVVHDGPSAAGYERRVDVALGDRLASATLPGIEVETATLVG